ncbi:hypothetical protein MRX96_044575 [Rhipicephalus microplus]
MQTTAVDSPTRARRADSRVECRRNLSSGDPPCAGPDHREVVEPYHRASPTTLTFAVVVVVVIVTEVAVFFGWGNTRNTRTKLMAVVEPHVGGDARLRRPREKPLRRRQLLASEGEQQLAASLGDCR